MRRAWLAVSAVIVTALATAGPAFAGTKQYLATFSPKNVNAGTFALTATIQNESEPQTLGAVNLLVPSGLTVTGITSTSSSNGTWSAQLGTCPAFNSNAGSVACVQLRGASLAPASGQTPGESVTVGLTVKSAPSNCSGGSTIYLWVTDVRQSNNFNGGGNELGGADPASQLQTVVNNTSSGSHLSFVSEPANAHVNTPITNQPYNQPIAGQPVEVDVLDSCGHLVNASPTVNLTLNQPAGAGARLEGGSAQASGGKATFSGLEVTAPGYGYTLTASDFSGDAADQSHQFDVTNDGVFCPQDTTCQNSATASDSNSSTVVASPQQGSNAGYLNESVDIGTTHLIDCSDPSRGGYTSVTPDTFGFSMVPSDNRTEVWTTTTRHFILPLPEALSQLLGSSQVCYGSVHAFVMANGQAAPGGLFLPDGSIGFIGTLPSCSQGIPSNPCIDQANVGKTVDLGNGVGYDISVPIDVPAGEGDPWNH